MSRLLTDPSDKHSTFSTTFPIFIKERKTIEVPVAPVTPASDDEDELNDDLDTDETSPAGTEYDEVTDEDWIRVNDKAPIWMR